MIEYKKQRSSNLFEEKLHRLMCCSPSPPAALDYAGAAREQGAANKEAALASGMLSNPNIYSPEGTQTVAYTNDPATGNPIPTLTKTYSPENQALYNKNINLQGLMADLGITGATKAGGVIGENVDFSGAPAMPGDAAATRDSVINAMMSRVNTDLDRRQDDTNSKLIAAGIRPGTEAYSREMEAIDRTRTDARQQAILAAGAEGQRDFGQDIDRRRQAITEYLAQRQTPLQEINALRSGSQISPLQFQGYTGATVAPPPIYGAAKDAGAYGTDVYNANTGMYNAQMRGLFDLGAAVVMEYSDRRLKSNIVRIGTHPLGIGIYEYDIFGKRDVGVMAQELIEVMPEAVMTMPNGYMAVDYGRL